MTFASALPRWLVMWLRGAHLLRGERRESDEDGQQQQLLHGGEPSPRPAARLAVDVLLACDSAA